MKDPSNEVIKVFFTALNGNTTLPVYTMVPDDVDSFILIGDYSGLEDSAKDTFIFDSTITIELVKRYSGQGSKKEVNDDVNTIFGIVRDDFASGLTMTGFCMSVVTVGNIVDFVEEDDEYKIYRKIIRFNMIITEV